MRADYPYAYRWLLHIDDLSGIEGEWDAADAPFKPIETVGTAPGAIGNIVLPVVALVMLILSLIPRKKAGSD